LVLWKKDESLCTSSTVIEVESEFTLVERQVMFFYIEWTMQVITTTEYTAQITKLGYTTTSVTSLTKSKQTQLKAMEKEIVKKV
jgi:hypothetical protein